MRAALGTEITPEEAAAISAEDLRQIAVISRAQSVMSIVSDGYDILCDRGLIKAKDMPNDLLNTWLKGTRETEMRYERLLGHMADTAALLESHGLRTYQLKGAVFAECYPVPQHRRSLDADCFVMSPSGQPGAWEKANTIMESVPGCKVERGYYKHSSFKFSKLKIENHQFLTPFRGNSTLIEMERLLQGLLRNDDGSERIPGTAICKPPVMVSALFLIEHAYSHFLSEGLKIQQIMDWVLFLRKHRGQIDMQKFEGYLDKFALRAFYESFSNVGNYLAGHLDEEGKSLSHKDLLMLEDMWKGPEGSDGFGIKGKLELARNIARSHWKYREFSNISMPRALFIKVRGYLFQPHPKI